MPLSAVFGTTFGILRFRQGPQDLPSSWAFAVGAIAVYVAVNLVTQAQLGDSEAGPRTLLWIGIQFAAVAALLNARGLAARLAQTLCALAATGTAISLVSYAIVAQADPSRDQPVLALLLIGVFAWSLLVDGHIYRHALSTTLSKGMLVAVVIFAVSYSLVEFLV
jgi:hypothetical protein